MLAGTGPAKVQLLVLQKDIPSAQPQKYEQKRSGPKQRFHNGMCATIQRKLHTAPKVREKMTANRESI